VNRSTAAEREVIVHSAGAELAGLLTLPDPAAGLVVFAHGSGSSRFSRRLIGAIAAAAAARPDPVGAVVSRGGRPDLAPEALPLVGSPTLFLVGAQDVEVLQLNSQAAAQLIAPHAIQLVPGATHLFEEPGTLEQAAHLARDWFLQHLAVARP
jgi:pimeloyl-ACP methyl ester carboxylesterase